jgi:nitrous oxidase accessory protein NosD
VVSPTGNDAASGSESAPLRTIAKAVTLAGPGDLIRVRAGTYAERLLISSSVRAGTPQAPITLLGEGKPRIVPGSQEGALVVVEQPHWIIRGLDIDVQNRPAFAVAFTGDNTGTVLAESEIHHGAYGGGVSFHHGATGATLEDNHIHDFFLNGVDAHGVIIQPTARQITVRNNVIHSNSGDSIQCHSPDGYEPEAPADEVLIEGNDLYGNVEQALDIKTCHNVVVRGNRMHLSRKGNGAMVVHFSAKNILIEENDIYDAGVGIAVGGIRFGEPPSGVVIRRNRIRDMLMGEGMTGAGLLFTVSTGTQVYNNTLTGVQGTAVIAGSGDGGPTQNLVMKNNIIDAARALSLGSAAPGLRMNTNLYRPGATFRKGNSAWNLSQWKGQGQDGNSFEASPLFSNTDTLAPVSAAIDYGEKLGIGFCGAAPDLGGVESGC